MQFTDFKHQRDIHDILRKYHPLAKVLASQSQHDAHTTVPESKLILIHPSSFARNAKGGVVEVNYALHQTAMQSFTNNAMLVAPPVMSPNDVSSKGGATSTAETGGHEEGTQQQQIVAVAGSTAAERLLWSRESDRTEVSVATINDTFNVYDFINERSSLAKQSRRQEHQLKTLLHSQINQSAERLALCRNGVHDPYSHQQQRQQQLLCFSQQQKSANNTMNSNASFSNTYGELPDTSAIPDESITNGSFFISNNVPLHYATASSATPHHQNYSSVANHLRQQHHHHVLGDAMKEEDEQQRQKHHSRVQHDKDDGNDDEDEEMTRMRTQQQQQSMRSRRSFFFADVPPDWSANTPETSVSVTKHGGDNGIDTPTSTSAASNNNTTTTFFTKNRFATDDPLHSTPTPMMTTTTTTTNSRQGHLKPSSSQHLPPSRTLGKIDTESSTGSFASTLHNGSIGYHQQQPPPCGAAQSGSPADALRKQRDDFLRFPEVRAATVLARRSSTATGVGGGPVSSPTYALSEESRTPVATSASLGHRTAQDKTSDVKSKSLMRPPGNSPLLVKAHHSNTSNLPPLAGKRRGAGGGEDEALANEVRRIRLEPIPSGQKHTSIIEESHKEFDRFYDSCLSTLRRKTAEQRNKYHKKYCALDMSDELPFRASANEILYHVEKLIVDEERQSTRKEQQFKVIALFSEVETFCIAHYQHNTFAMQLVEAARRLVKDDELVPTPEMYMPKVVQQLPPQFYLIDEVTTVAMHLAEVFHVSRTHAAQLLRAYAKPFIVDRSEGLDAALEDRTYHIQHSSSHHVAKQ